ncbi:NACHT domain-containing protein [Prochlorothrix hollandica]|uniref:NACHT domain-containing protein n=1 Tax=Prochlorothrix hollandica TaxID=1223 RepID=UPI0011D1A4D7|nr:NACHT domain-containing protein [Prochlorothrix hollandica]
MKLSFIPLGLVEKKQTKVKRGDIASPEQGSRLYELQQEEVVRRFDRADEFFETVIQGEQSPRIMIIGEPGAGKTTILQTIATQLPDGVLPVWVSLADLQDQTLDEYLFGGDWLKLADRTLPREAGEEFKQLFKEGRVCLLLDGVDEMAVAGGRSQLRVIYEQVRGWEAYVRVIMTCRVNVWEAAPLFEKFQVYRNLPLAYPDQVEQYIDNFFRNPALSLQSGEALKQELRSNARVQDTVKNPLCLALLCHAWFSCGGKLPETQAKLYEMFLEAFYKIKQEQFDIGPDQQKALNQALGQLALEALDREQSWYRIDQVTAQKILGHPEQPGSFFYQTLQLGLLNRIGFVAEDPSQECYAFIHPTFQEYLASLSSKIKGWHYFFNHNNENPNGSLGMRPYSV